MGNTIWVQVQGRPTKETASDHSIMCHLMDNLDALAEKLRVRKLSEFYDYSAIEAEFADFDEDSDDSDDEADEDIDDEDSEELGEDDNEEEEDEEDEGQRLKERDSKGDWFDSVEGLKSIKAMRLHLEEQFDDLGFVADRGRAHWPAAIMEELRASEKVVEAAAANRQRFRLLIVP